MRGNIVLAAALFALATPARGQWADYPGAVRDPAAEARAVAAARGSGATPMVATTPDSFDAVLDFYRARGRVVVPPLLPGQAGKGDERELPGGWRSGPRGREALPSGVRIRQVIVILDGAADVAASADWLSLTRPFVGDAGQHGDEIFYLDVRNATGILRVTRP